MDRNHQLFFFFWPGMTNNFGAAIKHYTQGRISLAGGWKTLHSVTSFFHTRVYLFRAGPEQLTLLLGHSQSARKDNDAKWWWGQVPLSVAEFVCAPFPFRSHPISKKALALSIWQYATTQTNYLLAQILPPDQMTDWGGDDCTKLQSAEMYKQVSGQREKEEWVG